MGQAKSTLCEGCQSKISLQYDVAANRRDRRNAEKHIYCADCYDLSKGSQQQQDNREFSNRLNLEGIKLT